MGKLTDLTQMQSCMERTSDCLSNVAGTAAAAIIQMGNTLSTPMTGASSSVAGASGMVPAPSAGDEFKHLLGNGTWKDVVVIGTTEPAYPCVWIRTI